MAASRSKQSVRSKASASRSGKPAGAKRPAVKPAKSAKSVKPSARPKPAARPVARAKPAKPGSLKAAPKKPAPVVKSAAGKSATVKSMVAKAAAAKAAAARPIAHGPDPAVRVTTGAKPGTAARIVAGARIAPVPRPPGKTAGSKSGKPAKVAPPAVVRPLGVLPPEARAKVVEKAPLAAPRPRPAVATPAKPAAHGAQRVSEKDLKIFEERLLAERQKILKDMGHIENTVLKVNQRDSSGDLSGYSFHMADAGTDAMEREKAFMFASAEGRMLMEVDDALRRLYQGEYGICELCGKPIARARLEAMPYARLCVSCKEQEEKANRSKGPAPGPSGP